MHGPLPALGLTIVICVGACMTFDRDRSLVTRLAGIAVMLAAVKFLFST